MAHKEGMQDMDSSGASVLHQVVTFDGHIHAPITWAETT